MNYLLWLKVRISFVGKILVGITLYLGDDAIPIYQYFFLAGKCHTVCRSQVTRW